MNAGIGQPCTRSLKGPGRVFSRGFDLYGICGRRLPNSLMTLYVGKPFFAFLWWAKEIIDLCGNVKITLDIPKSTKFQLKPSISGLCRSL